MGARKRHPTTREAPRRYQSGAQPIDGRVRLGEALSKALEPLGLGVAVIDPESLRFVFASAPLAELVGTTPDELALAPVIDRFAPEDLAETVAFFAAEDHARKVERLRLVHASGDRVTVEVSARPFDDDKLSRCLAIVVREVRSRRDSTHAHAHLQRAIDEATVALSARDELFSIAAHDLKTPLTSLRLHAQSLQRGLQREPADVARARRAVDEVERHAERMTLLIDQLLDVARIHGGRLELERAPADLAMIVREVGTRFGPEVASRGATIIIDGERSVPGRWDPLRLDQIVTNLVSNALKYGEGNPIVLELRSSSARVRLSVRDYGPGIAPEEQSRIFEPFERANASRGTRGSGLGLWIVRRLVEAHGGEVSVSSVVGKGAVFIVDLPRNAR